MADASVYEKMNLLYLGRELDTETGETTTRPFLYKNKNLTTHAAIIGMTGSGKTGLGIDLIEEAAMDGLPSIIIDPKGDMTNLLLTFPGLAEQDFEPWVDEGIAEQQGISRNELARQTAETWKKGLASWDQDAARIARLRDKVDIAVYTPGSTSGRPVSVLDNLEAPSADILQDNDTAGALVNSAVSSLLALVGINADPLKSREHILLSSLLLFFWRKEQDVTLEMLIGAVVNPPFSRIGSLSTDVFFPQAQRMELAMQLNNILASPAFSGWTTGEPLAIERFLYTAAGKPRVAIFTIAHLSDDERMFFVSMLLGRFIAWMRRQEGSSGLRCLLYMDEIFGYFPPNSNPPSKKPMLLLLKQARAYGVGIVLSTQNPVDLDYKGLSNIGTWFIGRLQTRQDQDKVMAGIAGSSDTLGVQEIRALLADMRGRTFLMYSTKYDEPVLFETRWAMSYLRGPISLAELRQVITSKPDKEERSPDHAFSSGLDVQKTGFSPVAPILSSGIEQCFLQAPVPLEEIHYTPLLVGTASVRFFKQRLAIDVVQEVAMALPVSGDVDICWRLAESYEFSEQACMENAVHGSLFAPLTPIFEGLKNLRLQEKEFDDYLYHSRKLPLLSVPSLKLVARPGETEVQFKQRLADIVLEKKAVEAQTIQDRYAKKQARLEERLDRAYARLDKEKSDVTARGIDTALSIGGAIFGALFGRKKLSVTNANRTVRSMRGAGRVLKEKGDVQRAEEVVSSLLADVDNLALELQEKLAAIADQYDPMNYRIETLQITPRHTDIFNIRLILVWEPIVELL